MNASRVAIISLYSFHGRRFAEIYITKGEPGATIAMHQRAWMTLNSSRHGFYISLQVFRRLEEFRLNNIF